jgi:hypothetical protein
MTRHLNQKELAARWNLSHRTLERWRWIGEGPQYLKIGGRVVYRLEDVEAVEADQIRKSTSGPPLREVMNRLNPTPALARRSGAIDAEIALNAVVDDKSR